MALIFVILTFFSTLIGGLFGLRFRDHLHLILGFTAGVLLGVVSFDVLPEIIRMLSALNMNPTSPMVALVLGFLSFHVLEKVLLVHHEHEHSYGAHKHPSVGVASALALSGHSFLDGVGIGLGFQISPTIGVLIALAVIAHDFSDGLNTVSLALLNKNSQKKSFKLLLIDAFAPILGALSTRFFTIPDNYLVLYLGFFAGFLLYIGASEILPEAHSEHSSLTTIGLTIAGTVFIFLVSRVM